MSLSSGNRTLVAKRLEEDWKPNWTLSPGGGFVLYYQDGDYHLFDVASGERRNVTADLGAPFADEDHDYPSAPPGYGFSEWLADDSAIFIYDKYDIWQVPTDGSEPFNLTEGSGRQQELTLRVVDMDPEEDSIEPGSHLLVEGYHQKQKHDALYTAQPGQRRYDQAPRNRQASRGVPRQGRGCQPNPLHPGALRRVSGSLDYGPRPLGWELG